MTSFADDNPDGRQTTVHDPVVELLIGRALRLARDNIDTQLAAGELIRAARGQLALLHRARDAVAQRWLASDNNQLAARALGPLQAAERSLEDEQAAWSKLMSSPRA